MLDLPPFTEGLERQSRLGAGASADRERQALALHLDHVAGGLRKQRDRLVDQRRDGDGRSG
jgi:hypothetical protein